MIRQLFTEVSCRLGLNSENVHRLKNIWLTIGLFWLVFTSRAQQESVDSVLSLPSFMVTAERIEGWTAGQKIDRLDSIHFQPLQSQNLGQTLSMSSAIQINTYSYNGLSTLSFRGTSTAQTGILWHGIPLNQAANGLLDLSLLPSGLFNEIRVLHGGGSSLLGSGMIGGSIHLGSEPLFESGLEVQAGLFGGSFGNIGGSAGFTFSSEKWVSNTRLIGKNADNNFTYTDLSGDDQRLRNARQRQGGILQDLYYRTTNGWTIGASVWLQENDKQIPATLTSKPSDASQNDRSLRSMASVKKQLKKGDLQLKTALIADRSHYQDPDSLESVAIDSKIASDVWISDVQFNHSLGSIILLNGGSRYIYTEAKSDFYENLETQNQAAVFASFLLQVPSIDWKFNLNLRQEWVDNYSVPFTPAFGAEGRIFRFISGKVSVSRNFRIPTLNDRYWIPGGNPDLQPESSWNQEASLIFNLNMRKMRNKTRMVFTVFNADVDQWILWIPDGNLWTAQNVQKVWARGGEIEYRSSFYLGATQIAFNGGYTYARSTNQKTTSENDQSYQKQLIYVPEHRYFFTGKLLYKGYSFAYNQSSTGKRYTTRDNSESLPGYSLGNIYLRKILVRNRHSIDMGLAVNNIWDVDYQSVQYNPMPGRHMEINIIYKFKNSNQ